MLYWEVPCDVSAERAEGDEGDGHGGHEGPHGSADDAPKPMVRRRHLERELFRSQLIFV